MFNIIKKYVSTSLEKSGCDLCQRNIYMYETYYELVDYYNDKLITYCEFCKPKLLQKIEEACEE